MELEEEMLESGTGVHRASFLDVEGEYELTTGWPITQAVGNLEGVDFYFRAKNGEWEFQTVDKNGHSFPGGHPYYFVRRGMYDEAKPNALTIEWSLRKLRKCIGEFFRR